MAAIDLILTKCRLLCKEAIISVSNSTKIIFRTELES